MRAHLKARNGTAITTVVFVVGPLGPLGPDGPFPVALDVKCSSNEELERPPNALLGTVGTKTLNPMYIQEEYN